MKNALSTIASIVFMSVGLIACQTPAHKSIEDVRVGMDKATVLEIAGGPSVKHRVGGMDRWIYKFENDPSKTEVRELQFSNGRVTYFGPPVKPAVSADEQDRINEESNLAESQKMQEYENERDEQLGIERTASAKTKKRARPDRLDRKLRESLYGLPPDPEEESRITVPVFEPVK